jgi:hypothetical protein
MGCAASLWTSQEQKGQVAGRDGRGKDKRRNSNIVPDTKPDFVLSPVDILDKLDKRAAILCWEEMGGKKEAKYWWNTKTGVRTEIDQPRPLDVESMSFPFDMKNVCFAGAVVVEDNFLFTPATAECIVNYNVAKGKMTRTTHSLTGSWSAATLSGNLVVAPPAHGPILVYDGKVFYSADPKDFAIDSRSENGASDEPWPLWGGATEVRGWMIAPPSASDVFLLFNGAQKEIRVRPAGGPPGGCAYSGAVSYGDSVLCVPFHRKHIAIFDVPTDTVAAIDSHTGKVLGEPDAVADRDDSEKWHGGCVLGEWAFLVPFDEDAIIMYNFVTKRIRRLPTEHVATGRGKWAGATVSGARVVCAPYNADCVLIYDSQKDEVYGIPVADKVGTGPKKYRCCAAIGDLVAFPPYKASSLLVVLLPNKQERFSSRTSQDLRVENIGATL